MENLFRKSDQNFRSNPTCLASHQCSMNNFSKQSDLPCSPSVQHVIRPFFRISAAAEFPTFRCLPSARDLFAGIFFLSPTKFESITNCLASSTKTRISNNSRLTKQHFKPSLVPCFGQFFGKTFSHRPTVSFPGSCST